ncbi:MAG: hypothetical protein CVU64_03585 [Deltaproteobacteria bacterium HGW-Deltaproteobacteria-21]|nr:MAG: hypothetical protein CVU64_03585 [Deltaproteobacteria bacterium HGW-Deltaproteobacteria-21]
MLTRIIKTLLIILLLACLGALAYWLCIWKGWPLWVGAVLVAGVIGLWAGILFLKKHLLRSREKKFVQRVIDQDTAAIAKVPVSERHQLTELQEHWKESVKRLQNSHLRKRGNPLYVLPWYVVMGESGAGKTSAIRNAGLNSPLTEVSRAGGIAGTRNCDWWFFDNAVILDTAGRYTIPIEESQDLEEWKQFLTLLSKYRKKEPLNGAIVAMAADRVLDPDEKVLTEQGQAVRRRIDQVMHVVGAKFPVYIMVTKMDLVHGFTEFGRHLPPGSLSQAMGFNNRKKRIYWKDVVDEAVSSVGEKLRRLRFALVHQSGAHAPGAINLVNEFNRLQPGLELFLKALFEENPYQETPLLRGLYFSSARREGNARSAFLEITGIDPGKADVAHPEDGFFLQDFFGKILPRDRNIYTPIREFLQWRRLTRSLGLFSWLLIGFAFCGLLTFSFYFNAQSVRGFKEDFFDPPRLTNDRTVDLITMDKMRIEILEMERNNRRGLFPDFGLRHSRKAVALLKRHYSRLFREGFLTPVDHKFYENVHQVTHSTPEEEFVDYLGYVVARITVLKEQLGGRKLSHADDFRKITASLMQTQSPGMPLAPEIAAKFSDVYYAYLSWNPEKSDTEEKLSQLRIALVQLLEKKGNDLKWLVKKWVPGVPDISLSDFWGISEVGDHAGTARLSGAYTAEGRKHIRDFIVLVEAALGDGAEKALFEKRKGEFWNWYAQEFHTSWLAFMERFHEGLNRLDTVAGWQRMAALMTTPRNPYLRLLQRAADEFSSLGPVKDPPPWSAMVTRIEEVRELAKAERDKGKGSSLSATLKEKEAKLKVEVLHGRKEGAREHEEKLLQAKAWNEYVDTLEKINVGVSSRKECYDMFSGSFSFMEQNPAADQSPFSVAYSSYSKLRGLLGGDKEFPAIWDIILGPLDFVMVYASDETACFLQTQWEEQVLGVLQSADPDKAARILFNKTDGAVWKFLESTAKPFIGRNESGYYMRRDFRKNAIPFKPEFIRFLNQGSEGLINFEPSYTVSLETMPLDVNDDAEVEPFACLLEVNCADGNTALENYNFPNSATITWVPEKCGDVNLTFLLPQMTLRKTYKGKMGFPQFLKEFGDGSRIFTPEDFPDQKDGLKRMSISSITVSYKIKGGDSVIRLLKRAPTQVPSSIVMCYARGKG